LKHFLVLGIRRSRCNSKWPTAYPRPHHASFDRKTLSSTAITQKSLPFTTNFHIRQPIYFPNWKKFSKSSKIKIN